MAKSKAREFEALVSWVPEVGIWRPLSSTRLNSGPTPRTVTFEPSPPTRSIDTPLMRCSDSARLVSGNLPMSSATMPSTTPCDSRLRFMADCRLPRIPTTVTASSSADCCASLAFLSASAFLAASVAALSAAGSTCAPVAASWAMTGLARASNRAAVSSLCFGKWRVWFMDSPSQEFTVELMWCNGGRLCPASCPWLIRRLNDSVVNNG